MSRDQQSLRDIWNAAQAILDFAAEMDKPSLTSDRRTQVAVLYEIVVMGKAANRLSDGFRSQHATIPWQGIIGMRNKPHPIWELEFPLKQKPGIWMWSRCILTHQYDKVDVDVVWNVVHQDISELIAIIKPLLSDQR